MALSGSVGGMRGRSFSETSGSAVSTRNESEAHKAKAAIDELQGFIVGMMKQNVQSTKAIKGDVLVGISCLNGWQIHDRLSSSYRKLNYACNPSIDLVPSPVHR